MAQGKAFTEEQRETIIQSLQDWLELGFSRNKACAFIGLKPNTLSNWVKEDEALGMKLVGWENANNKIAMSNIRDAMVKESETEDLKKENSWKWVSAKEETMKPKQDITSDDKALPTPILTVTKDVHTNDSDAEDSSTE